MAKTYGASVKLVYKNGRQQPLLTSRPINEVVNGLNDLTHLQVDELESMVRFEGGREAPILTEPNGHTVTGYTIKDEEGAVRIGLVGVDETVGRKYVKGIEITIRGATSHQRAQSIKKKLVRIYDPEGKLKALVEKE